MAILRRKSCHAFFSLPRVIAHRGASAYAPENTRAAMQKAKALGATWVEFDVQLTADNELVVFHDATLARTTNGKGSVRGTTLAELRLLDAGSWFHENFQGEGILTFQEMMACLSALELSANVEIKPGKGDEALTARLTQQSIETHWPENLNPPLVSSFSWESLRIVRAMSAEASLGLLMHVWNKNWQFVAHEIQPVSVHIYHRALTHKRIEAVKSDARKILAYTVDDPAQAARLFALGVDGIFTNSPDKLLVR